MRNRTFITLIVIVFALLFFSCNTTSYQEVYPLLGDGKYDSEFPYRGCSAQLEQIAESVRMVNCIAFYKSLSFPAEQKMRKSDLMDPRYIRKATMETYLTKSSSGSCTVISFDQNKLAVLTCAHIIYFPDTLITYFPDDDNKPSEIIQSISIKDHQKNFIGTIQGAGNLEILAMDRGNDIAVLGQKIIEPTASSIPVFRYPLGKAKDLEWGAFVYLFGYPAGYRIVTKGIVSSPNRDKNGSFLTDGVFNRGFSGGIALAIRDGIPNFEFVGMVRMTPGFQEYFLTPSKEGENSDFILGSSYSGMTYIDSRMEIIYGVSPTIPVEVIVEFLRANEHTFDKKGYSLSSFYKPQPPRLPEY